MRPTRIVLFKTADYDDQIGVNPLHVMVVRPHSEGTCALEMVETYRLDENRTLTVKGSVEQVIDLLNSTITASVTVANDGDRALTVSARGDSSTQEPPVLEPGDERCIQVIGDLHVKVTAEES